MFRMTKQKKHDRRPPAETMFKPGQSGNPSGKPKMPEELQKANKLSAKKFIEYVNRYINMDREDIKEDMKRPEATMLELLVAGMISRAVSQQDPVRANFILDRTIGKVIDRMQIDVEVIAKPMIIHRIDGSEVELGHKLIEQKTTEVIDVEVLKNRYELRTGEEDEGDS